MRQVFFDTETTGLSAEGGDRILELGCVEMVNRQLTGNYLHLYINPERASHEDALRVHGITEAFLADKPKFAEIVDEFVEFVRDAELVIHNAAFDIGFVNAEMKRLRRPPINDVVNGVRDTLLMARDMFPARPTRWMRCAAASTWTTPSASCTAPTSTRSCWPRSIST